jgi:hypothetical protein
MSSSSDLCQRTNPNGELVCQHPLKEHCKGGVEHHGYKFLMHMMKDPNPITCTTRHCEVSLCTCCDFVEASDVRV